MRTETVSIYQFDELSNQSKEKAREWYREGALDYEWWDSVYDDAQSIFAILGIDSHNHHGKKPAIQFSGFWSQGDGACFEGTYAYKRGSVRAIKRYAPQDQELHRIATELMHVQRRNGYRLTASLTHKDRYCHEHSVSINVDECSRDDEETIKEALRDLMRWIYRTLEREHDYLMSDESVDENIRINEYEFTANGDRA